MPGTAMDAAENVLDLQKMPEVAARICSPAQTRLLLRLGLPKPTGRHGCYSAGELLGRLRAGRPAYLSLEFAPITSRLGGYRCSLFSDPALSPDGRGFLCADGASLNPAIACASVLIVAIQREWITAQS